MRSSDTTHITFMSDIQKLVKVFRKEIAENPGGGITAKGLAEAALAAVDGVSAEDICKAMKCIGVQPDAAVDGFLSEIEKSSTIISGGLYTGEVTGVNYVTKTLEVKIKGTAVNGCLYVAGAMATFFGIENSSLPPVGAIVLVYYTETTSPPLVLGTLGGQQPTVEAMLDSISGQYTEDNFTASATEGLKPKVENSKYASIGQGPPIPMDLVAGEMNLNMSTGPMIRLLHNFAQLGASDAAKVEACIFNDMVRIVDNYFVHHTCGGDELVWSAGRCTRENHFTGYPFEAEGKLTPEEELCPEEDKGIYNLKKNLKSITGDTGRWRLSEYVGFLGDMIHRWVTTPTAVASNIMEKALRAGQFRSWVGSDGTYMLQAAGGIQMEVTQCIVIPEILRAWNDPYFDMEKALKDLDGEFLKIWGTGPDWEDVKVAVWQLQYYTRYITLWHSLSRFRQLKDKKYCNIPAEVEVPERTPTAKEEDKEAANPDAKEKGPTGHAVLSMDPAGNIALRSNNHTSITMYNGNIQIACPGNLELKAGGIVSMQGNTVSIRGAQRVEITSIFGTLVTTARTAWKALCELGTIWLKGDGRKDIELPKDELQERIEALVQEPREFAEFAVVLDASKGKTMIHGHQGVVIDAKDEAGHITMQADGPKSHINIHATNDIRLCTGRRIFMKARSFITHITEGIYFLKSKAINFLDMLTLQEGAVHVNNLKGNTISAYQAFIGRNDRVTKVEQKTLDEYYTPVLNTVELVASDKEEEEEPKMDKKADTAIAEQMKLKFKTSFDWDKLYTEFSDNMAGTLYEAPYESYSKCEEAEKGEEGTPFVRIKISDVQQSKTSSVKESAPRNQWIVYPQKFSKQVTSVKPEDKKLQLGEKWEKDFTKDDIKGIKDMTSEEFTYTFIKPQSELK